MDVIQIADHLQGAVFSTPRHLDTSISVLTELSGLSKLYLQLILHVLIGLSAQPEHATLMIALPVNTPAPSHFCPVTITIKFT